MSEARIKVMESGGYGRARYFAYSPNERNPMSSDGEEREEQRNDRTDRQSSSEELALRIVADVGLDYISYQLLGSVPDATEGNAIYQNKGFESIVVKIVMMFDRGYHRFKKRNTDIPNADLKPAYLKFLRKVIDRGFDEAERRYLGLYAEPNFPGWLRTRMVQLIEQGMVSSFSGIGSGIPVVLPLC